MEDNFLTTVNFAPSSPGERPSVRAVLVVAPALVFGIFETIVAPGGRPFDVDRHREAAHAAARDWMKFSQTCGSRARP